MVWLLKLLFQEAEVGSGFFFLGAYKEKKKKKNGVLQDFIVALVKCLPDKLFLAQSYKVNY